MKGRALVLIAAAGLGACVLDRAGGLAPEETAAATTVTSSSASSSASASVSASASMSASSSSTTGSGGAGGAMASGGGGQGGGLPLVGWDHRKPIVLQSSQIDGGASNSLGNFPVLISLSADADLAAGAQANGDDIRFTAADGVTPLDHEIESYDTGTLVAWVRIPTLPGDTDTTIYMYFGNAAVGLQENADGVWGASFAAVYHMDNDFSAGDELDSSGANKHATPINTVTTIAGPVGPAADTGNPDGFSIGQTDLGNDFTIALWFRKENSGNRDTILSNSNDGSSTPGFRFYVQGSTGDLVFETGNDSSGNSVRADGSITDDTWHHVAAVVDRDGGDAVLYVDGVNATTMTGIHSNFANNNAMRIGMTLSSTNQVVGDFDELRISTVRRPGAWIVTSHNNQSNPSAFHMVGAIEP